MTIKTISLPTVSIGIPLYNSEKYLRRTLDNLLTQTFSDFEIIISDDASKDLTPKICAEYIRIRFIQQSQNLGMAGNFEFVLQQAKGKYFMWVADDEWSENYIECLVNRLDSNPTIDFAYASHVLIDENSRITGGESKIALFFRPRSYMPKLYNAAVFFLWINCSAIFGMYRRHILTQRQPLFNLFQADNAVASDTRFLMEIMLHHKVIYTSKCQFKYRLILKPLDYYEKTEVKSKIDFKKYVQENKSEIRQLQTELTQYAIFPLKKQYPIFATLLLFMYKLIRIRRNLKSNL
ncbi:putative glycosyltransferase [Beggiatoa alba B18LD]|uniref:Putative glycosyltransferase n=1 Tax=Beggiatoa alba B18LD TaxID=395493 RepID=I3CHN7_9GAMM|nr:glycosyltransferase family 2 protein [Beggiatoa alba]EIJ43130.1 putative glycosyltransferase [Beggiatoa alba B18LD]